MARMRTIKPEFFRSELAARCSIPARLTYIGLLGEADDHGRGVANPRTLKGALWSLDDDVSWAEVDGYLAELERSGHIVIYEVDGKRLYEVQRFAEHQSPSHRRGKPVHPAPCGTVHADACKDMHGASEGVLEQGAGNRNQGANEVAPLPGSIDADFAAWWAAYPRRDEERASRRAYAKTRAGGASCVELLVAARHYASSIPAGADERFVKLAKNFLDAGELWRDYLEPPASGCNGQERALGWDPSELRR